MSRRNRHAAFSLFSFQDIVTSVTAILILIVLILSLELLDRRQAAAAASSAVTRAGLMETIAELEDVAARLEKDLPSAGALVPLATRTAAELERDARIVEGQAARASADASAAKAVERRAAVAAATAAAEVRAHEHDIGRVDALRTEAVAADAEARQRAVENEREQDRLAQKRQELATAPRAGTQLVFNVAPDSGNQPWLVEVSAEGVATVKLGSNRRQVLGVIDGPTSALSVWIDSLRPATDYVLILVRPSGIDSYERIRELLQSRNIVLGIDFIGEDQAVRDGVGERSAPSGER